MRLGRDPIVLAAVFALSLMARAATTQTSATISPGSVASGTTAPMASLPMYELSASVKRADDIFWSRLREKLTSQGLEAPVALERTNGPLVDEWEGKNLLLSQACGFPYVHILMQQGVKIVGTPVYTTNDGLPPGEYQSFIVVKAGTPYKSLADLKGKKAGVNDMGSNSGMNAFRSAVAASFQEDELKHGIFSSVTTTDGHLKSVRMIADGEIDVASIDSVTYDLIRRDYPELAAKTRILMKTLPSPGLPMITSAQTDDATVEKMRVAIKEIVSNPGDDELRWALREMKLKDFVVIDQQVYHQRIDHLEDLARDKGYPTLK